MPNSEIDAHRKRAAEHAKNMKNFEDAATAYVNEKGAGDTALEAARRAAKANRYKGAKIRVGGHQVPLDD